MTLKSRRTEPTPTQKPSSEPQNEFLKLKLRQTSRDGGPGPGKKTEPEPKVDFRGKLKSTVSCSVYIILSTRVCVCVCVCMCVCVDTYQAMYIIRDVLLVHSVAALLALCGVAYLCRYLWLVNRLPQS